MCTNISNEVYITPAKILDWYDDKYNFKVSSKISFSDQWKQKFQIFLLGRSLQSEI